MPRVGVISDIHGNNPALTAVLHELETKDVSYIVCLGDILGIGGFPSEVIAAVQESCKHSVRGNHDVYPFQGTPESTVEQIEKEVFFKEATDEQQSWLYRLPSLLRIESESVVLAHSKPEDGSASGVESGNSGVLPKEFTSIGSEVNARVVLLGHTHRAHAVDLRDFGHETLVVNPGSVGDVYQDTADYAIVDTESLAYELCSVPYDKTPVKQRIHEFEESYEISLWDVDETRRL